MGLLFAIQSNIKLFSIKDINCGEEERLKREMSKLNVVKASNKPTNAPKREFANFINLKRFAINVSIFLKMSNNNFTSTNNTAPATNVVPKLAVESAAIIASVVPAGIVAFV